MRIRHCICTVLGLLFGNMRDRHCIVYMYCIGTAVRELEGKALQRISVRSNDKNGFFTVMIAVQVHTVQCSLLS